MRDHARQLQAGITYLAFGEGVDENDDPILHNHDAIQSLGVSLTPVIAEEEHE